MLPQTRQPCYWLEMWGMANQSNRYDWNSTSGNEGREILLEAHGLEPIKGKMPGAQEPWRWDRRQSLCTSSLCSARASSLMGFKGWDPSSAKQAPVQSQSQAERPYVKWKELSPKRKYGLRTPSPLSFTRNSSYVHHVKFAQITSSRSQEIVSSHEDWSLPQVFLVSESPIWREHSDAQDKAAKLGSVSRPPQLKGLRQGGLPL